jgi:hypothetical protein
VCLLAWECILFEILPKYVFHSGSCIIYSKDVLYFRKMQIYLYFSLSVAMFAEKNYAKTDNF